MLHLTVSKTRPFRHGRAFRSYLIYVFGNAIFVERVDEVGSRQKLVGLPHEGRFPVDFGHAHVHVENTRHVQFDQMKILTDLV